MKLLIVESPKKAQHIRHILGHGWNVQATLGHIRDLPVHGEAAYIRPPDFAMRYEVIDAKHKDVVVNLRRAAQSADIVYLASDPDREGEAIAWHVCQVLKIDPKQARRVTYQEITEKAIRAAIQNPRHINMRLVAAQEARRALDRMVGWEVSPVLSNTVATTASAGRVQTPALRLIVEREREIRKFEPTLYFQVVAEFAGGWQALWQDGCKEGEFFTDKKFAIDLSLAVPKLSFRVSQAEMKPVKKGPQPPFTTSSLQIDGSRALKMGAEEIMKAAQALFEQGAITYHRTDSPNLSEEGETMLRETLKKISMPRAETPRRWKAKGDAQEAHEAIRPTDSDKETAGEDETQRALYDLIRKRALASQMPDAVYEQTSCTLDAGTFQDHSAVFRAVGSVLKIPGWKRLYQEAGQEEDGNTEKQAANPVPKLTVGDTLQAENGKLLGKKTKAPPRYTEATLIKALEDHGIGRPSTYASILHTLYGRKYVGRNGKEPPLFPTDLGEAVVEALTPFHFADVAYTREIEEQLDQILAGQASPKAVLNKAYADLASILRTMPGAKSENCPVEGCDGTVRRLESRRKPGVFFWVCSNKDAHAPLSDEDGKPGKPFAAEEPTAGDGPICPGCHVATIGKTTSNGHPYYVCPQCRQCWWNKGNLLGNAWPAQKPVPGPAKRRSGKKGTGRPKNPGKKPKNPAKNQQGKGRTGGQ